MLTPTVFELAFEAHPSLDFVAGQFLSVVIPGAGPKGRDLRRAYSIASPPESHPIELCIKLVEGGPGTQYLARLGPGDEFRGYAPYGDFIYRPKPGRHACFVATGTGVAPFRAMICSAMFQENRPLSATCLLGVREEAELLYTRDFRQLPFVRWVPCLSGPASPGWDGFRGRVTDYLRSVESTLPWRETEFYLCGSGAMIDEVKGILAAHGVEKTAIHQEIYYREPKPGADG